MSREEFNAEMKFTKSDKKEQQKVSDDGKANDIISGAQEVYLKDFGNLIFNWPDLGLAMQGDSMYAKFKATHLRKGDLLTEAELKAIYGKPVTVEVEGKDIVVGSGAWTVSDDSKLEDLPRELTRLNEELDYCRDEIHRTDEKILALGKTQKDKASKKKLETELGKQNDVAYSLWLKVSKLKLDILELQSNKIILFATSLEEQANFEKLKLFAPSCVKVKNETGTKPLWDNQETMLASGFGSVRVISLFGLFLRGADVSFFGDTPAVVT